MSSDNKLKSDREVDEIFEVWLNAPTYKDEPSMRYVSRMCNISQATVKRMRDRHGWIEKRKEHNKETRKKVDERRSDKDAEEVELVGNLYFAALNNLARKAKKYKNAQNDDRLYIKCSVAETIALGKYYALLRGDPDSRPDTGIHDISDELRSILRNKKFLQQLGDLDVED